MSLVVTFAPYADESGFGYYRRLVAENALWGWRELAGLAGVHKTRSALMERPTYVANALGLDTVWTEAAYKQEIAAREWRPWHRSSIDAVCPMCLQESAYLRHFWEHTYVTCCPVHKVRLVDQCTSCGDHLRQNREYLDHCACGHRLSESTVSTPTTAELWLSSLIMSGGKSSGVLLPKLRSVPVKPLCLLVRELCLLHDPSVAAPFRSAGAVKKVDGAVALLAPLDGLLAQWPLKFEEHVIMRIKEGKPNARTLNSLLGAWYIQLRKVSQGNGLELFLKVVMDVAAQNFDGVLGMDSSKHLAVGATNYVRLPQAAKMLGVGRDFLLRTVKEGACPYRTLRLGTRGLVYEIPEPDVLRIAQERTNWIHEDEAARSAEVGEVVLSHMMKAGVINSDVRWRNDILKAGPIERRSMDALFDALSGNEESKRIAEEDIIFWSEFTSRRMWDNLAIHTAMRAARDGELVPVRQGSSLGKIGFLKSEVAKYFGTPILEAGMSIRELSEKTGWKEDSIRHWLKEGLLGSEQVMMHGRLCSVVLPQHVVEFSRTYIPLGDLAKTMRTIPSALSRYFGGKVEFVGAKPLGGGVRRGVLIRVSDLVELAVAQVKSSAK